MDERYQNAYLSKKLSMKLMNNNSNALFVQHPMKKPLPRRNPFVKSKIIFTSQTDSKPLITDKAGKLKPLTFQLVSDYNQLQLWKEYIERYHYLGYKVIVGPQLKYFVSSYKQTLACIAFGAAAWSVNPRDLWIGWSNEIRKQNLYLIIDNVRFLIFPWVKSKNLASMVLAKASQIVAQHWQQQYGYKPVLLETFVDKKRFDGASYKTANWLYLGDTKGRGKMERLNHYPSSKELCLKYYRHLLYMTGILLFAVPQHTFAQSVQQLGQASIHPCVVTLEPGERQKFKVIKMARPLRPATLTENVKWSVKDIPGGDSEFGTIDANGIYQAPAKVSSPHEIHIIGKVDEVVNRELFATVIMAPEKPCRCYAGENLYS